MAILNNVPTLSYISWKNMLITYDEQTYQITNDYTMKPYIYWDYNNPYVLISSNEMLKELAGRFYIIFNDRGNQTLVPQTEIEITFGEDDTKNAVSEKILGFQEDLAENNKKFTTIEQTLEGIKQTTGEIEERVDGNLSSISQLTQTTNEINATIERVERKYREDNEAKELRDNISCAILDLQSVMGLFSNDMYEFMEDNKLSDEEEQAIITYQDHVVTSKLNLNTQLDTIIFMLEANGQTDKASTLTRQRDLLNDSVDNLNSSITNACLDDAFTNLEISSIISWFANVNSKINETKNLVDEYIFLGVGGELITEIGKLAVQQQQITLSVSKTEETIKNTLNIQKSLIQGIIDSNNTALNSLKKCYSTISNDREIIDEEIDSLNVRLDAFNKTVINIEEKKNELIENELLDEGIKNNLIYSYELFITEYNKLIDEINNSITDGITNDVELIKVNERFDAYYKQLNDIHTKMCNATDIIDLNTTNKAIADAKADIQIEINDLNDKLQELDTNVTASVISSLIDNQEKADILQNLEILEREKLDIDNRFNEWYNSEFLYGEAKINYKKTYDEYINKYNELKEFCEMVANKTDFVSDEEKLIIDRLEGEILVVLNNFLRESETTISVITSNEVNSVKNNLSKEFTDINNVLNDLGNQLEISFDDGLISEIELRNIENILNQIEKEKLDIDKTYEEIYNNTNLK